MKKLLPVCLGVCFCFCIVGCDENDSGVARANYNLEASPNTPYNELSYQDQMRICKENVRVINERESKFYPMGCLDEALFSAYGFDFLPSELSEHQLCTEVFHECLEDEPFARDANEECPEVLTRAHDCNLTTQQIGRLVNLETEAFERVHALFPKSCSSIRDTEALDQLYQTLDSDETLRALSLEDEWIYNQIEVGAHSECEWIVYLPSYAFFF